MAVLKEICAGIEENGVFYEIFEKEALSLDVLAYEAAKDSMMGSGIGVSGKAAAMQMKGIPMGKNVESCQAPDRSECRRIGANSARAIKKMSLL